MPCGHLHSIDVRDVLERQPVYLEYHNQFVQCDLLRLHHRSDLRHRIQLPMGAGKPSQLVLAEPLSRRVPPCNLRHPRLRLHVEHHQRHVLLQPLLRRIRGCLQHRHHLLVERHHQHLRQRSDQLRLQLLDDTDNLYHDVQWRYEHQHPHHR